MKETVTVTVPYNAEIAYKSFVYGVKTELPKISADGKFISFSCLTSKILIVFFYYIGFRRAYIVTGANENYKGKLIDLPGFDKPVKLIYTARGRVFYKLRSLLFSLTEENPYKVLCFPNIFWNKLTAMLQYKKYHQSDIDWLVEQYA